MPKYTHMQRLAADRIMTMHHGEMKSALMRDEVSLPVSGDRCLQASPGLKRLSKIGNVVVVRCPACWNLVGISKHNVVVGDTLCAERFWCLRSVPSSREVGRGRGWSMLVGRRNFKCRRMGSRACATRAVVMSIYGC